MADPDYISVRRPSDAPFRVLPDDLISEAPRSYDLALMRSLASDGLVTPITVRPLAGGRFRVVDGKKRLAAIGMLCKINKLAYDRLRGLARPARQVFAMVRCRLRPRPVVAPSE